jgi:hypothetical protein
MSVQDLLILSQYYTVTINGSEIMCQGTPITTFENYLVNFIQINIINEHQFKITLLGYNQKRPKKNHIIFVQSLGYESGHKLFQSYSELYDELIRLASSKNYRYVPRIKSTNINISVKA